MANNSAVKPKLDGSIEQIRNVRFKDEDFFQQVESRRNAEGKSFSAFAIEALQAKCNTPLVVDNTERQAAIDTARHDISVIADISLLVIMRKNIVSDNLKDVIESYRRLIPKKYNMHSERIALEELRLHDLFREKKINHFNTRVTVAGKYIAQWFNEQAQKCSSKEDVQELYERVMNNPWPNLLAGYTPYETEFGVWLSKLNADQFRKSEFFISMAR